ncbi:MAG: hypothetical protein GY757_55040 [bacterium]|nr:hypothetical protein [bacterium]
MEGYTPGGGLELANNGELLEVDTDTLGIDSHFFQAGGHSLKAGLLAARLQKELNLHIPLPEIFNHPTIRGLADYLKGAADARWTALVPVEKKEYYPLSFTQQRFFLLQQLVPESVGYNLPAAFILEGELHKERLRETFKRLVRRHESLRTSFVMVDDEPVQRVHDDGAMGFEICCSDAVGAGFTEEKIIADFSAPFLLEKAPLLRVALVKRGEDRHLLLIEMHHIITDGISVGILSSEFLPHYIDDVLPRLRIQYRDFARWQNHGPEKERIKNQESYWLKRFDGRVPPLSLPTDYPRPAVQSYEGDAVEFPIPATETRAIKALVLEEETTLYMVLFAIYNILLFKLNGGDELIVGTGVAGRGHTDLMNIVGLFFNTIPLRNRVKDGNTFKEFLKTVNRHSLEAFENQEYPFDKLVEILTQRGTLKRDPTRNPLFDTMFAMQNFEDNTGDTNRVEIPGLKMTEYPIKRNISRFDLFLMGTETGDGITMLLEYSTALFKPSTAGNITRNYLEIAAQVIKNKDIRIKDITVTSHLIKVTPKAGQDEYMDFDF